MPRKRRKEDEPPQRPQRPTLHPFDPTELHAGYDFRNPKPCPGGSHGIQTMYNELTKEHTACTKTMHCLLSKIVSPDEADTLYTGFKGKIAENGAQGVLDNVYSLQELYVRLLWGEGIKQFVLDINTRKKEPVRFCWKHARECFLDAVVGAIRARVAQHRNETAYIRGMPVYSKRVGEYEQALFVFNKRRRI
jgi:hypothetical protein